MLSQLQAGPACLQRAKVTQQYRYQSCPVVLPPTSSCLCHSLLLEPASSQNVAKRQLVTARSVEYVGGVTKEEAEVYDRMAASLVARLKDVTDEDEGNGAPLHHSQCLPVQNP